MNPKLYSNNLQIIPNDVQMKPKLYPNEFQIFWTYGLSLVDFGITGVELELFWLYECIS